MILFIQIMVFAIFLIHPIWHVFAATPVYVQEILYEKFFFDKFYFLAWTCKQVYLDNLRPAHTKGNSWAERHSWLLAKLFPQVCGVAFCVFLHTCHWRLIFNMLNNFVHEWTSLHNVRTSWAISSAVANAHVFFSYFELFSQLEMPEITQ